MPNQPDGLAAAMAHPIAGNDRLAPSTEEIVGGLAGEIIDPALSISPSIAPGTGAAMESAGAAPRRPGAVPRTHADGELPQLRIRRR